MRWLERFIPIPRCVGDEAIQEAEIKSARADAEVENQETRIAFTRELVKSNEAAAEMLVATAAERLVAAMTRDRVR